MQNDTNLDVVRACIISFDEISGYKEKGVLNTEKRIDWWDNNKDEVIKNLKE